MYQTFQVNGLDQTLLGSYSDLTSAQTAISLLDQSQIYSIVYSNPLTGIVTVIQ